ncbi:MAG TPA: glycerophosphodiester phosphodiesterase family protein [Dysgonamonadaceae bacterium]|nr:glycerophosphodiester phosphodiesterase family protein [Dysgonamonadaceae bacterium]
MRKKLTLAVSLLLLTLCVGEIAAQPQIIAHRGYWKTDGSAQNSIAALLKADSLGVYGSECDLWLSSDGVPVVYHDATAIANGEKITLEESPLATLKKVTLANGESLPTFEEYLDAFEPCKNVKLIIEFKTHKAKEREDELAKKVIDAVHQRNLCDRVEYISFGMNFINRVRALDPSAKVYYLSGDLAPEALHAVGAAGIDYHFNVIYKHPEWVTSAHDLGMKVNVWTVNKREDIEKMIDLKVDYITTDEPLLVREIINEKK